MVLLMTPMQASSIIHDAYERCKRRFPTIELSQEVYGARLQEISDASGTTAFEELHLEDVFLALACSRGDRIAWEYFADEYSAFLRRAAMQACRSMSESEDLAQELIASLLGNRDKLSNYGGRASLATWLRVAVAHAAIDRFRRKGRNTSLEEMEEQGRTFSAAGNESESGDAEAQLDAHWGTVLVRLIADEIQRLDARDRLLLRLYYVHGASLKSIGRQFLVHEATISRHLDGLRKELRKAVERQLRRDHRLSKGEIASIWHWAEVEDNTLLREALGK